MYGPRMYGTWRLVAPVERGPVAVVVDRDRHPHGTSPGSWCRGPGRTGRTGGLHGPLDELPDVGKVADPLQRAVRGGLLSGSGLVQGGARLIGRQRRPALRAQHALHAGERARDDRSGARGAAERARVPGVLVRAGSGLVGPSQYAARGRHVAAPALGVERAAPVGEGEARAGGARAAGRLRLHRPGSSRSRARPGGRGSGGAGGSRARGRRRSDHRGPGRRCRPPRPRSRRGRRRTGSRSGRRASSSWGGSRAGPRSPGPSADLLAASPRAGCLRGAAPRRRRRSRCALPQRSSGW